MSGVWSPTVKVEVRFDGTSWTDVSAYVQLASGLSVVHGRDSEVGDPINPGTLSLVLTNGDGRFSPDVAASPYYPYVVEGVQIRASSLADGSYVPLFYGTVQSWSVSLQGGTVGSAVCTVTAVASLGALPSYTLRQAADEVVRALRPVHHWPLREADGDAQPMVGSAKLIANNSDGWGLAPALPMDEGDALHPLLTASSGNLQLTSEPLSVGSRWRMYVVVLSEPTASGTLFKITTDNGADGVRWTVGSGFDLTSGASTGYALPTTWPVLLEIGSSSGGLTKVVQVTHADGTSSSTATFSYPGLAIVRKVVFNPTLSGGMAWGAAHAMIFHANTYEGLPSSSNIARLILSSSRVLSTVYNPSAVDFVADIGAITITGATTGATTLPPLEGRDLADVMGALATGTGARIRDDLDGTLTWIEFPPDGTPATMPAHEIDPSLTWETSSVGWVSDCTVTWPDGTTYTATRADGKRTSLGIEGVHTTRLQDRCWADWIVNTASTGARLSRASYDLTTLTDAQRATLAAVTVGSRTTTTDLPSAIMPATITSIVEGVEDEISDLGWRRTFKYSPDVYELLGVYGTDTYDSGAIWAP